MHAKTIFGSLGLIGVIVLGLLSFGFFAPELFFDDVFLAFVLSLFIVIGVIASYVYNFKLFKKITGIVFGIALVVNIFWFLILEYSAQFYIIYFSLCNLCFVFVYALLYHLLPLYAIKFQQKYETSTVRGYHIHENTYGIMFLVLGGFGVFLSGFTTNIALLDFLIYHILLYLGTAIIILGAFLIGRDYNDILKLKFIQKREAIEIDPDFNVRKKLYHGGKFGIVLIILGVVFLFQNRIWAEFYLNPSLFMIIGLVLIVLGSFLGGVNPTYFAKKANILK